MEWKVGEETRSGKGGERKEGMTAGGGEKRGEFKYTRALFKGKSFLPSPHNTQVFDFSSFCHGDKWEKERS